MGRRTALFDRHRALGATTVDFGGWDMPLHYGSQIAEHHAVRRAAGVFDVSHMGVVDVDGARSREFLERLLANDVTRLTAPGRALYGCMLNEAGGIVDDLLAYRLEASAFRIVVNAGRREADLAWIRRHAAEFGVSVVEREDLAMLAVQGPEARALTAKLLPPAHAPEALALAPFHARPFDDWYVSRTGYTGEDGFEVMLPTARAVDLFEALRAAGAVPCGLGARDTLRLEAGLNLYGNDMDEETDPFESALGWTVAMRPVTRRFIGRDALEAIERRGSARKLVGLLLVDRGVLRRHQTVTAPGVGEGEITSGGFSPTLERSIAFARVPAATGAEVEVDVRGRALRARVVKPPFVRNGQPLVS